MGKRTNRELNVDFQPVDYDFQHLDVIDGHVSDYEAAPPRQLPAIRQQDRLVLPKQSRGELTPRQQMGAAGASAMLGTVMQSPLAGGHARQDDNALTIAHGHNIASKPKLIVTGVVFGLLAVAVALLWQMGSAQFVLTAALAGAVWGGVALFILHKDRAVALHHSAPGIEHHRIDATGETQRAAIAAWERIMLASVKGDDNE